MQSLSGIQKILIAVFVVALAGGAYFFYSSRASTEIALTLTTNPTLEDGLVGHWTFDGADVDWSSTTAEIRDRSGNNYHGNATTTMTATTSPTKGRIGQGVEFNGSTDHIYVGDIGTVKSVSAWIRADDTTARDVISLNDNAVIELSSSLLNGFGWTSPTHYVDGIQGAQAIDTSWHHIVVTTATGINATSTDLGDRSNDLFMGLMDDVRIYNRALSADEVKRLYELGATTKVAQTLTENPNLENGLVGHWTFDGKDIDWSSTTAEILDRSPTGYTGNAIDNTNQTKVVEGVIGQAMHFATGTVKECIYGNGEVLITEAPLTASLWIKADNDWNGGTDSYVITQRSIGDPYSSWRHYWHHATGWRWGVFDSGGTEFKADSDTNITLGVWYHMVGVLKSNYDMELWVNGVLQADQPNSGSIFTATDQVNVGCADGTMIYAKPFNGSIDDIRIYNRVLSADEVKRLYQLGATTKVAQTLTENPNLENGLVGHWTFDGADIDWSSTTAEIRDRSGNNNHGSTTATMSATSSPTEGVLGQGLGLDGVDDYVGVPDHSSLDITADITVAGWIKLDTQPPASGATAYPRLLQKGTKISGALTTVAYMLDINTPGGVSTTPKFSVFISDTTFGVGAEENISINTWHHVTGVRNGTDMHIYVDGVWASTTSGVVGSLDNEGNLYLGESLGNSDGMLDGSLDDVRIYNRALSADEVKRLYDLGQ